MELSLYHYRAVVRRVYDGDTCTVDIDLGLNCWVHNENVRLSRINAPEVRGTQRSEGLLSRDFLRSLIMDKEIIIETIKDKYGKYGRYLVEIWLKDNNETWVNINDLLVEQGYAIYKTY
jgi:micrococcal nuclease